jgi:hypothetical protein
MAVFCGSVIFAVSILVFLRQLRMYGRSA